MRPQSEVTPLFHIFTAMNFRNEHFILNTNVHFKSLPSYVALIEPLSANIQEEPALYFTTISK